MGYYNMIKVGTLQISNLKIKVFIPKYLLFQLFIYKCKSDSWKDLILFYFILFYCIYLFVLGIKLRTFCLPGKHCAAELYPQPKTPF